MTNIVNPSLSPQLVNGTIADATQVMSLLNSIVSQLNTNGLALADLPNAMLNSGALGSFNNVQFLTSSGTYTPGAKSTAALVIGQGSGAGGGGAQSGGISAGSGGGSGTAAMLWVPNSLATQTVTIGAAGGGVSGANGSNGGSSSFGTLLVVPGGIGGLLGNLATGTGVGPQTPSNSALSVLPSGTGNIVWSKYGTPGAIGIQGGSTFPYGGNGAPSMFGTPGIGGTASSNPNAAGYGAGGSGANTGSGPAAGFLGAPGCFLVIEFAG